MTISALGFTAIPQTGDGWFPILKMLYDNALIAMVFLEG
ncbi:MAG: hypothetical protein PWQ60_740 [Thermoanaerobacteraceae bacterium]|nr:hypothetical protein [Thermoanaerobacteraceae bacterium]